MKKLCLIALVATALMGNAATVKWGSSAVAYGIPDASAATTDGATITAGTTKMKGNGTWTYVMTILSGTTEVGSASGTVAFGSTGKISTSVNLDMAAGDYNYSIVISGGQTGLPDGSSLSTTLTGSFTLQAVGDSGITSSAPSSWKVTASGTQPDVPEPTSALLLLMGGAMLALRRKQK